MGATPKRRVLGASLGKAAKRQACAVDSEARAAQADRAAMSDRLEMVGLAVLTPLVVIGCAWLLEMRLAEMARGL